MSYDRPTQDQLRSIAKGFGFDFSASELDEYGVLLDETLREHDALERLEADDPAPVVGRDGGRRPDISENPLNAWHRKTRISGTGDGPLSGRTVVLKDNISLAGVQMANGSALLDGFVPDRDATVVTRILAAGGTIVGKAVCEHLCMSGGSHTADSGPVHNPHRPGHSAGGSSSGCGALVAAGEADMAIGGDQGGSIRIPASYCGIVGLKPTHGLVPYTGIMPIEATIDHAGPMTRNVVDNARLLQVIAGPDGLDPRQTQPPPPADYEAALNQGVAGLRIGLLQEGFEVAVMQEAVAAKVRAAADRFGAFGAEIASVSVPAHREAFSVWTAVAVEGLTVQMMQGNGMGHNWRGRYDPALMQVQSRWREAPDRLPPTLKLAMLAGGWSLSRHGGRTYARAQNLALAMRARFDAAFQHFDLLLMPTLPRVASPLPGPDACLTEIVTRANELNASTAPFDLTGHPAISLPCGLSDGLPVGLMLIGPHFGEATIYRAAAAFERSGDWRGF